jgi:hypothetical protein
MYIEVSTGEVADKISILLIKKEKITDVDKLENIKKELSSLIEHFPAEILIDKLYSLLCAVNLSLWEIEDAIREKERLGEFDNEFIELARQVYITNDSRAALKMRINIMYNSDIIEEKSYNPY